MSRQIAEQIAGGIGWRSPRFVGGADRSQTLVADDDSRLWLGVTVAASGCQLHAGRVDADGVFLEPVPGTESAFIDPQDTPLLLLAAHRALDDALRTRPRH